MLGYKIEEIAGVISGRVIQGDPELIVNNISIDSRTLQSGDLFIALPGLNFDGHNFVWEALEKGAKGAVIRKDKKNYIIHNQKLKDKVLVEVEDTLIALQVWSKHYKNAFNTLNICITGSNGKSTTKELIAHLLGQKIPLLKTAGSYNNEIGIPLTLLQLNHSYRLLVVEMGMRGRGEIKMLTDLVAPHLAIITNIGEAHIGLLGSRENIFKAKSELLYSLGSSGIAFLNGDDSYYARMKEIVKDKEIVSFGLNCPSDFMADDIQLVEEDGISFSLKIKGKKSKKMFLPLLGRHNLYNALAAIAVSYHLNLDWELMEKGLASFKPLDMHLQLIQLPNKIKILNDAYNANPLSMKKALETLVEIGKNKRKIVVLGDMLELGKKNYFYHQQIGKEIVKFPIDILCTIGEGGRIIAQSAKKEGMPEKRVFSYQKNNKKYLAKRLRNIFQSGDLILLKGSRDMHMEEILKLWQEDFPEMIESGRNK